MCGTGKMSLNYCCLGSQFLRHIYHSKVTLLKKNKNQNRGLYFYSIWNPRFHLLSFNITCREAADLAAVLSQAEGPHRPLSWISLMAVRSWSALKSRVRSHLAHPPTRQPNTNLSITAMPLGAAPWAGTGAFRIHFSRTSTQIPNQDARVLPG